MNWKHVACGWHDGDPTVLDVMQVGEARCPLCGSLFRWVTDAKDAALLERIRWHERRLVAFQGYLTELMREMDMLMADNPASHLCCRKLHELRRRLTNDLLAEADEDSP